MRNLRDIVEPKQSYQNIGSILPLIAAAGITAAAGIGSALIGSSAQKKALKLQAQEAARQNAIDEKQLALAERMIDLGLATQIDSQGNITTFDESTNTWKVIPSAITKQLQDASNDEILRQFNFDAPLARGEAMRESMRRTREGGVADSALEDYKSFQQGAGKTSAKNIESSLRLARERAVTQGFDDVSNSIATQALRSGASGAGAAAQLAKARSQAIAQIMGNPDIEGEQTADALNANRSADLINKYNTFASRASGAPGFAAPTNNTTPALTATLNNLRSGAGSSLNGAGNLLNAAGQPNSVPGVFNPAGVIGAIGNAGADFLSALGNNRSGIPLQSWQDPAVSMPEARRALDSLKRGESF